MEGRSPKNSQFAEYATFKDDSVYSGCQFVKCQTLGNVQNFLATAVPGHTQTPSRFRKANWLRTGFSWSEECIHTRRLKMDGIGLRGFHWCVAKWSTKDSGLYLNSFWSLDPLLRRPEGHWMRWDKPGFNSGRLDSAATIAILTNDTAGTSIGR